LIPCNLSVIKEFIPESVNIKVGTGSMAFKKIFTVILLFFVFSVSVTFAQAFLNPYKYFTAFPMKTGDNLSNNAFVWAADRDTYDIIAGLTGKDDIIDSYLEFALLSFYSPAVMKLRPVGANTILPANNTRSAALKLGSAVYRELMEINYFDANNTEAIERYENMLQFICEKNSLTRQLIENYYRANIKSFITEVVNDEFNRISFSLVNLAEGRRYFISLIRNPQNGRYTMYYEVPAVVTTVKTVAAAARETLINELRRKPAEFSPSDVEFIRSQALMIPAVAFPAAVSTDVINTVTAFYTNLNKDTYNALLVKWKDLFEQEERGQIAALSYSRALAYLNDGLADIGL